MCTFFHASNIAFQINEKFSIDMFDGDCTFDHQNRPEEEQNVNDILDRSRPPEVPLSKKKCIYLYENLLQCKEYAVKEGIEHIYEVKCEDFYGPFPMVLVKKCRENMDNEGIRTEYWQPNHNWKEMEFITSAFVVIQEIPFDKIKPMMADYADDIVLARRLFG